MSLLVPDTGLLFWMTLSFGIVFFILARYAFPMITGSVEKRNKYIQDSLTAAHEAEARLASLNEDAEALMKKARDERKAMLDQALDAKKRIEEEAREATEGEIRQLMSKAVAEIEESKRKALEEVKDQIIDISVRIAGKVVNEELASDKKQKELIDRLLREEMVYKS